MRIFKRIKGFFENEDLMRKVILIFNWLYWIFKTIADLFNAGEEILKTFGRYKENEEAASKRDKKRAKKNKKRSK